MSEMRSSYLVQRLEKPRATPGGLLGVFKDNPFSFGGGLKNGGLSPDAMDLLRDIFAFDYMGAAEFEFGEVPKALSKIANCKTLEAFKFGILLSQVPKDYRDKSEENPPRGAKATIYVLAPLEWHDEIVNRITEWAGKAYGARLKEQTHLSQVLRPFAEDKYPTRVAGWLELDNGFMFFSDREMWEKTCALFGVST